MFMTNTPDNIYAVLLNPFFTGAPGDEVPGDEHVVVPDPTQPEPDAEGVKQRLNDEIPSTVENIFVNTSARDGTEVEVVDPTFFFLSEIVVDATHAF
jgi:hypothetical protein